MYTRILVGCDGSDEQAGALALAQQLREPEGGTLILTTVFPLERPLARAGSLPEYGRWLGEQAAEVVAAAEAAVAPGVPVERQVIAAPSAAAGLNDVAELAEADLIVLGHSDRGAVSDMLGRKTVQRLLHGAPCAVAVAGADQYRPAGRICVAYDGSVESEFALDSAYGIAAATSAEVLVCEVLEPIEIAAGFVGAADGPEVEDAVRAELEAAASRAPDGVAVTPRLLKGSPPYRLLLDAAADAGLIVAGSRGYGPLQRAIAGGTSVYLLTGATCAVLVTPRAVAERASRPL